MKKRKVIFWLKLLSEKETAEFVRTLKGKETDKKLFKFLIQYAPDYDHQDLDTDDKALKMTFGRDGKKKDIANKASDLKLLVEEFIYKIALEKHPLEKKRLLALELQRRKQPADAIDTLKKARKTILENDPWHNIERMRMAYDIYFDPSFEKFGNEAKKILAECKQDLTEAHHIISTILAIEQNSRQLILGENIPVDKNTQASPLLKLLQQVKNLFDPEKKQDFQVVKEQLTSGSWPQTEHDIITTHLLNFSIKQIQRQQDNQTWKEETFDLFKYGIEKEALLQNGQLSENHFVSAIILACLLKQTDWGWQLAEKGDSLLAGNNKDFHIKLAYARLEFAKGDFLAVHERLYNEAYANIADSLKVRTLLAKTYIELSLPNKEAIVNPFDYLESLRSYLHRNKEMLKEKQEPFNNFIQISKKLLQARFQKDKLPDLQASIQNKGEALDNREWLLKKVVELLKKS